MAIWFGPAEALWLAWAGWWLWTHRRRRSTWAPSSTAPVVVYRSRPANLLNAQGVLDSVRTIFGEPPSELHTNRTTYYLDHAAVGPHWIYRSRG